jgi:transposase
MKEKDARFLPPVVQQELRQRAIELFLDNTSQKNISKILGVSRQSVWKWVKSYKELGDKGLKIRKRGRPQGGQLQPWQSAQVVKIVKNSCPDEIGMPFLLWTRESIGSLIKKIFDITLSKWTVGRYLSKWGFSPQKPSRKAVEQNPQAIRNWLQIEYQRIHKQANKEQATIHWGDEMGLRSDHNVGRTYGLKGKTPIVKRAGNRFSCSMISTITNLGRLSFMIFEENFNEDIFLKFLKRLVCQSSRKIFLIVDQHSAHKSKKTKEWLRLNEKDIRIFYLPSYCPELNPDEFLNQDVKANVGRKVSHTRIEMRKNLNAYLRMRQKQPYIIQNYITKCQTVYANH